MKLIWDAVGEKQYESGTSKGVLYPQAADGKYPKGTAWNGLTSVNEAPSGAEETKLWADNIQYGSLRAAETFGGTIEAYMSPLEFGPCDGTAMPVKGVYLGQQKRTPFGLCYRTEIGNDANPEAGYKLHLVYGATASPSAKDYATINESPEAITLSWEMTTIPVNVEGYKPTALLVVNSTEVEETKLKALEDVLYGTETNEAKLPLPAEVITLLTA